MQNCPLTCGKCKEGLISNIPSASPLNIPSASPILEEFPTLVLQANATIDLLSLDLSINSDNLKILEDVLKQVFQKYVPPGALVDFVKCYFSFQRTTIGKTIIVTTIEFDCKTSTCEGQFKHIAMYEDQLKTQLGEGIQNNEILADLTRSLEELGIFIEWIPNQNAEIIIESTFKIIDPLSTLSPSLRKSDNPSASSTNHPTKSPSKKPVNNITIKPSAPSSSESPSALSTTSPSALPSVPIIDSKAPSLVPFHMPPGDPSSRPSNLPSILPSKASLTRSLRPSITPSTAPSLLPSLRVSMEPSELPSALPTKIISTSSSPSIPLSCQNFP